MKYIAFVRQECPFCVKAISLLAEHDLEHTIINFEESQRGILQEIKEAHDWPTVPMIFCKSEKDIQLVGGYTDLVKFLEADE